MHTFTTLILGIVSTLPDHNLQDISIQWYVNVSTFQRMNIIYRIFVAFLLLANSAWLHADELNQLLQQGQENLANGYYRDAERQLAQVEQQATAQHNNDYLLVLVHALQGYLALQRQQDNDAERLLNHALALAKQHQWYDLTTRINLYLAQLYEHQQNGQQADYYFQQAVANPKKVTDQALLVSAYYQLAKRAIDHHQAQAASQQLQHASTLMNTLPAHSANSQLWLNIGYQSLQLYQLSPQQPLLTAAFNHLNRALTLARQQQQPRIQAAALKHLASLYQQQQHSNEAIQLLQEGIHLAQQQDASDLLIDLEWKIAELYQQQNNINAAIAAYRQAVNQIDHIRIDIPVSYQQGRSSFRDTFAPIYLSLADLLLRQAKIAPFEQQQPLLAEARDSIERMKKSELEDYFQSRCNMIATPINLQKTDPHAAALYPIVLPDRLEIIVATANGLHRFASSVTAKELEQQTRLFANQLHNYSDFSQTKKQAQQLYQWLIAPVTGLLQQQQIATLIYIPDGVLRLVPLAALYNGKKFVIEQYAVATSPGLSLIDSSNSQHQNRLLLAGISVPGNVVSDLPDTLLTNLIPTNSSKKRGGYQRATPIAEQQQKMRELHELLRNPIMVEKLQKLLSLPGVDSEIKQLAEQNHANYLLNENFSLENFTEQLKAQPYDILHIASHGFFGSTAGDSFIMTYDKILSLNQLEMLLSSDYFKHFPIDLLVLSACQTAEGDDRSPLGISGVAIKTKVHSALGSLWSVSDLATAELMMTFYQALNQPQQTKAKALQQAMLKLLKQPQFANPSYWSPFVLIGNWI
jgi:CHAT domain-containing protein